MNTDESKQGQSAESLSNHHPPVFSPADILLYAGGDPEDFAVVACDQYTSEPDYWERVRRRTEGKASAYHLIFPEVYLKDGGFDERIRSINQTMGEYLNRPVFVKHPHSLIYVRRYLQNGSVRRGLVGRIDLEEYDYMAGSQSKIRATEGTVLERIPPRVKIREHASLELPHVMLLIDDPQKTVIEPLEQWADSQPPAYSFSLMENSGKLEGFLLSEEEIRRVLASLLEMEEKAAETAGEHAPLPYAVGDGNHSLATARQCYLNLKETLGEEAARQSPARYALVELVNLHDASLQFEAIHRYVSGVDAGAVLDAMANYYSLSDTPLPHSQKVVALLPSGSRTVYITNPSRNLPVGSLQAFLDEYTRTSGGETDYIHGEDVVEKLVHTKGGIGFLLEPMAKEELFPTVRLDGALPRKTFSMGEACDKRFYYEARKIR